MANELTSLIAVATANAELSGGLIGESRGDNRMVRVQRVKQNRASQPTHYRIDVWELPSGRKLLKAEWTKEVA